jgi:Uma2 family endonuclease
MASAAQSRPTLLLTLEEYLQTSFRPDCDFVDGIVEERNVGDTKHGLLQMYLGFWFMSHQAEWKIRVIGELRTQVAHNRVRLPDVAVVHDDAALRETLRVTPLFIAIEILSPDDQIPRVKRRLDDFVAMGVTNVWLLDPVKCEAHTYARSGLTLVTARQLSIPGSPVYLDLPKLFASMESL